MKHIITIIAAILFAVSGYSQKIIEESIKVDAQKEVFIDFEFADDVTIKGWDKDEIYIKVSIDINDNKDNDAFSLELTKHSNSIDIISDIENMKEISQNRVTIHKSKDGKRTITYHDNHFIDMDLNFEVFVPHTMSITAESINGNFTLTNIDGKMDIESISGFIDVSIDKKDKVSVSTSTISGGVYTDHDIELKSKKANNRYHMVAGRSPKFNLNGGGKSIKLETISGDIYIR